MWLITLGVGLLGGVIWSPMVRAEILGYIGRLTIFMFHIFNILPDPRFESSQKQGIYSEADLYRWLCIPVPPGTSERDVSGRNVGAAPEASPEKGSFSFGSLSLSTKAFGFPSPSSPSAEIDIPEKPRSPAVYGKGAATLPAPAASATYTPAPKVQHYATLPPAHAPAVNAKAAVATASRAHIRSHSATLPPLPTSTQTPHFAIAGVGAAAIPAPTSPSHSAAASHGVDTDVVSAPLIGLDAGAAEACDAYAEAAPADASTDSDYDVVSLSALSDAVGPVEDPIIIASEAVVASTPAISRTPHYDSVPPSPLHVSAPGIHPTSPSGASPALSVIAPLPVTSPMAVASPRASASPGRVATPALPTLVEATLEEEDADGDNEPNRVEQPPVTSPHVLAPEEKSVGMSAQSPSPAATEQPAAEGAPAKEGDLLEFAEVVASCLPAALSVPLQKAMHIAIEPTSFRLLVREGYTPMRTIAVDWDGQGVLRIGGDSVPLAEITHVIPGKRKSLMAVLEEVKHLPAGECFAVINKDRVWDVHTGDRKTRDMWVQGLKELIKSLT